MKTIYVCRGHISLYVNFHSNRTMWSTNSKGKRAENRFGENRFKVFDFKESMIVVQTLIRSR